MTDEEKLSMFERAVKFQFDGPDEDPIYVESRGKSGWAISNGGAVYNTDGEWEYEPMPSSRSDDFIARTRYPLEDALERAGRMRIKASMVIR